MARIASTKAVSGAGAVLALALLCPAAAALEPAVPLVRVHHRRDHHWFVWLPRHPDYEAVEIAVDLADRPLKREGAGLTDQSGHSAETVFLLFQRARTAMARGNEVRIGGRDYSFRPGDDRTGEHRFTSAYGAGIQIVVFPFGRWSFARRGARLEDPAAGLSFAVVERG